MYPQLVHAIALNETLSNALTIKLIRPSHPVTTRSPPHIGQGVGAGCCDTSFMFLLVFCIVLLLCKTFKKGKYTMSIKLVGYDVDTLILNVRYSDPSVHSCETRVR